MIDLITNKTLPPKFPIQLNTAYFAQLIPELAQKYPNAPIEIYIYANSPPESIFNTSGVYVRGTFYTNVSVIQNNAPVGVFTLDLTVYTSVNVAVNEGNVTGKIDFLDLTLVQVSSQIGTIDCSGLNDVVRLAVTDFGIPLFNKHFASGIPIPVVAGLSFVQPTIIYGNDYIGITTNFKYVPPSEEEEPEV